MLEIRNFSKSYPQTPLYEDFNLTVNDGEICCILGESGSGKTTLLNAVASLTDYSGEITAHKCGYIFQTPRLMPNLTVKGNLKLVCKNEAAIDAMLSKTSLLDKADSYPARLSGGEAQRAAIARAFLYGGDVMLMDEPFSSLDVKLKSQMIRLFFEIWRESKPAVLYVTHDPSEAAAVGNRIVIISHGKKTFDETLPDAPPRADCHDVSDRLVRELMRT